MICIPHQTFGSSDPAGWDREACGT